MKKLILICSVLFSFPVFAEYDAPMIFSAAGSTIFANGSKEVCDLNASRGQFTCGGFLSQGGNNKLYRCIGNFGDGNGGIGQPCNSFKISAVTCPLTNNGNNFIRRNFTLETCTYSGTPACSTPEVYDPFTGQCEDPNTLAKLFKAKGSPSCGVEARVGNPINPATGNKFQPEIIIADSRGDLNFSLYYNSVDADSTGDMYIDGRWSANYFQSLSSPSSVLGSRIIVTRPDQKRYQLSCVSNGVCAGGADIKFTLEKTATGFTLITENNVSESYDTTGKLLSITPLSGETLTLSYNTTTDFLETITDSYGRELNFTYDSNRRVETVIDPDGQIYTLTYDVLIVSNLISVIYPDNTPASNGDNPTRQYEYNDPNFASLLTGIVDENGNQFANFGYDAEGRAIFSEHSGGAERVDLVYNADGTTTVTDSAGASNIFTFDIVSFVPKTVGITGGQCGSGCSSQGQDQTYDANGFLASRTDFEGNVTNFINNIRGLQESRTEAVGTAEQRTISTEWHPDFRLPTKITEPGKETLFTYDSNGRLLSRTEREI